jgi:peptidoglycan/LPS O-acetylase OafA/YrhL
VAAESLAYLWFPVIAYCIGKLSSSWSTRLILLGVLALFPLIETWYPLKTWLPLQYTNVHGVSDVIRIAEEFTVGCLLFNLHKNPAKLSTLWHDVLGLLLMVAIYGVMTLRTSHDQTTYYLMALLIMMLAKPGPLLNGLLGNKVALYLGERSYAVYLCHSLWVMGAAWAIAQLPHTPGVLWGVVAGCMLCAMATAHGLHAWVETPARKWLRQRWQPPTA